MEHWSAVTQLVLTILIAVFTGVYVRFTYHIMKWSMKQSEAVPESWSDWATSARQNSMWMAEVTGQ